MPDKEELKRIQQREIVKLLDQAISNPNQWVETKPKMGGLYVSGIVMGKLVSLLNALGVPYEQQKERIRVLPVSL